MNLRLLLGLALLAPMLAGCLTDQFDTAGVDSVPEGTQVGDPLPVTVFEASGMLMAPDPNGLTCERTQTGCVIHEWLLPATSADGISQSATEVRIELHETSPGSVDIDLRVLDAAGNELGASNSANLGGSPGERVVLGPMPPQLLQIEVRGYAGAAMGYHVYAEADMVAAESSSADAAAGAVTVTKQGDQYVARRTMTYERAVSAVTGDARGSTGAGAISFIASGSDYHLTAELAGRGDTEEEARQRLAEITVDHGFQDRDLLNIDVHARPGPGGWNDKEASLYFEVPTGISWGQVRMETIAGAVVLRNLDAQGLFGTTTAGSVTADNVAVGDMDLTSSAGSITANVRTPLRSGTWHLDSTAGAIDLDLVESASTGYDVDARTSAGSVNFHFSDAETTSTDCEYASCHKKARTPGYESRDIQVMVDLDTTAGSITAGS